MVELSQERFLQGRSPCRSYETAHLHVNRFDVIHQPVEKRAVKSCQKVN